jgi:hypothetical protein
MVAEGCTVDEKVMRKPIGTDLRWLMMSIPFGGGC